MLRGCGRLFLLLLLACDWAGDPYFGHSPLSHPWSSQVAVCRSLDCVGDALPPVSPEEHVACSALGRAVTAGPAAAGALAVFSRQDPLPTVVPTPLRC